MYSCSKCGEVFRSEISVRRHLWEEHRRSNPTIHRDFFRYQAATWLRVVYFLRALHIVRTVDDLELEWGREVPLEYEDD